MRRKKIKIHDCELIVSDTGRVWSAPRTIVHKNGRVHYYAEKELKTHLRKGYVEVQGWVNGTFHNYRVHRLVALAFIPNPNNFPYINHKDACKSNNNVSNLEWCSQQDNSLHAKHMGLLGRCKKIHCITDDKYFDCAYDADRYYGLNLGSSSVSCRRKKPYKGLLFEYV